ncbi:uncharacterized protein RCO7_09266 [Rhynchosporium graminicola]|uniref:Uncharacterized protein n=1 Tax=Rhynchosporium graminicola TaxID=2792576 RepID=A0A1E1KY63_9HELO|nr:uncharacterized protein RCO7_09266 [Rhynchosporium commune]
MANVRCSASICFRVVVDFKALLFDPSKTMYDVGLEIRNPSESQIVRRPNSVIPLIFPSTSLPGYNPQLRRTVSFDDAKSNPVPDFNIFL